MKLFWLVVKNLRRNLIRSTLTALGTMVLVFVVTLVWSILSFLQNATDEKNSNLKAIVTERWRRAIRQSADAYGRPGRDEIRDHQYPRGSRQAHSPPLRDRAVELSR